jgi:hypothetical protein
MRYSWNQCVYLTIMCWVLLLKLQVHRIFLLYGQLDQSAVLMLASICYMIHFFHVVRALLISLIIQGHGKAPWSKDCFCWRWTVQVCVCHCSTINWFLFSIIHRPNIGSLHSLHIISLTCQVLSCKKNLLISCGLVFLFFVSLS